MSTSILPSQASQDVTLFDSQYSLPTSSGSGKLLLWIVVGLSVIGLLISGYLTWTTWTASAVLGCSGDGAGCDHVLTSIWSKWLGLPVSLFGLVTYLGILASALFSTRDDQGWAPTLMLTLALTAAGSATWFIGLQVFVIEHICWWCMTVHCCSLLICTLSVFYLFTRGSSAAPVEQMSAFFGGPVSSEASYDNDNDLARPAAKPLMASALASIGLVLLMGGQFFLNEYFQPSGLKYEEVASVTPEEETSEEVSTVEPPVETARVTPVVTEPTVEETDVVVQADLTSDSKEEVKDDFSDLISETPTQENSPAAETDAVEIDDIFVNNDVASEGDTTASLASIDKPLNSDASLDDIFGNDDQEPSEVVPAQMTEDTVETPAEEPVSKPEPRAYSARKETPRRMVKFASLRDPIDVTKAPILGSPDAEKILVEMLDYTCPHCRNLHPHVEASLERYGNQVAFVIVHVPLSKKCNPYVKRDHWSHKNACDYARLSLSVWKLDRSKFAEFHGWLMEGSKPPSNIAARQFAMDLVGDEVLVSESLKSDSFSTFAGNSDRMMKMNSGLPLILTEQGKVSGIPTNERDWFNFLETRVGLKPVE